MNEQQREETPLPTAEEFEQALGVISNQKETIEWLWKRKNTPVLWYVALGFCMGLLLGTILAGLFLIPSRALEYNITWQLQTGRTVVEEYPSQIACLEVAVEMGPNYVCLPGPVYTY